MPLTRICPCIQRNPPAAIAAGVNPSFKYVETAKPAATLPRAAITAASIRRHRVFILNSSTPNSSTCYLTACR